MRTITGMKSNFQPKAVRLIDQNGEQKGVMPLSVAFNFADSAGLDLVCVNPNSEPPACKILDYGKQQYEKKKKEKESKQKSQTLKTVKFRPKIGDNDFQVKINNATKFLSKGNKVKLVVEFKGRERFHADVGEALLLRAFNSLESLGKADSNISQEARGLSLVVSPKASTEE